MNSREAILKALRKRDLAATELPDFGAEAIRYEDPRGQFLSALASVGGQGFVVPDRRRLVAAIRELPVLQQSRKVASLLDCGELGLGDLNQVSRPHDLEDLDVAIAPGHFGVAENGAVWVTDTGLKHRVVYFINQHLILVLPAQELVHNMHQAYERIELGRPRFGVFISGPSKTADIEQSLVIGAHGARSLHVFLVEDPQAR